MFGHCLTSGHTGVWIKLVQDCKVNETLSALLCLTPSLNAINTSLAANRQLSVRIHFEMSSYDVTGRTLQFHSDFQHLRNFTYVSDPVFFLFPGDGHSRTFFTDETHLVLEVNNFCLCFLLPAYEVMHSLDDCLLFKRLMLFLKKRDQRGVKN